MAKTIVGKLKKTIYRNLDSDFIIGSFENVNQPDKQFIATGNIFKITKDLTYLMSGKWVEHAKYGFQFVFESYCLQEPADESSIVAYLEKHIKGIGPASAEQLVEKYGEHCIKILKNAPERVSNENKRLSYKKALAISEQLSEGDKQQNILIQLEGLFTKVKGLPKRLANDVLNIYGLSAYEVVKSNPYQLIEMNRIGFVQADKVAMVCGIKSDDSERIKHGILYVIRQMMQESGDVWIKPSVVSENLSRLITNLNLEVFVNTTQQLIGEKVLVLNQKLVTLTHMNDNEDCIADCVVRFLN